MLYVDLATAQGSLTTEKVRRRAAALIEIGNIPDIGRMRQHLLVSCFDVYYAISGKIQEII